jgi:thioredoxin reductase (NADPH)
LSREFEIVVAGGGIAGLTAGLYAARAGRKTKVLTGALLGGHLVTVEIVEGVPGFPDGVPGYDFCPIAQEQAMNAGAEFVMAEADKIEPADGKWRVIGAEGEFLAGAVIVATGTVFKTLGVPGEKQMVGRGVSQCATCDGPMLGGKLAVVAGGGDSAVQEALTLAKFAARVIVLHRGGELAAQKTLAERVAGETKIELRPNMEIEEILGGDGVTGVRAKDTASGASEEITADAVFPFIGLTPNSALVDGLADLSTDGHVLVDDAMRTTAHGLFAAGTVRAGTAGQAVAAAGDGAVSAIAAARYLTDGAWSGQKS